MFLSILWLTSITHNSSIDIVSHPMGPVTWFNVRRWASYIISRAELQQIHYRLSQPSKAPEPMLSPFPSLLPSLSPILITLSSLWPGGVQASPWALKSPMPWTQQWGWWSIRVGTGLCLWDWVCPVVETQVMSVEKSLKGRKARMERLTQECLVNVPGWLEGAAPQHWHEVIRDSSEVSLEQEESIWQ